MKTHELKCYPEYYDEVAAGRKPFEVRKNDRDYQVGDALILRRYDPGTQEYTGESLTRTVTYVLPLENVPGLVVERGAVVLGLSHRGWTPCSKGLPEEDQEVLFQVRCDMMGGDLYGMYKGTYRDGTFWIDEYDHKSHIGAPVDAVLAWMPAPETYRGEA